MTQYEYYIINRVPVQNDALYQLNKLGQDGWKLVSVSYNTAYFIREIK